MELGLQEKVAVITGGSSGIGLPARLNSDSTRHNLSDELPPSSLNLWQGG
jgi:hypothetical protein